MYDLIIIGGGPAGASAGRAAGMAGLKTLLIEKAEFPRYKPCGGGLSEHAKSFLDFSIPKNIQERNISGIRIFYKGKVVENEKKKIFSTLVTRSMFDEFLMKKAEETGIEIKMSEKVIDFNEHDNFVTIQSNKSKYKSKYVIIAEGAGGAQDIKIPLENYGYMKLKEEYDIEFYDMSQDSHSTVNLLDINIHPMPIQTSNLMLDPNNYIISAAVMKTHGLAVVTLGLKNIVLAAPMNFGQGKNERGKLHTEPMMEDPRYFNYNHFMMSQYAFPDLTVIDGFVGMEGKGPLFGDPIEVGVAIASTDTIAADRIGTDVMGHDFNNVGHLVHCANTKMGVGDINKINLLGDKVVNCRKNFKRVENWEKIIKWN